MQVVIAKNGTKAGPFTEEQVSSMITAGMISRDELAWTDGAADWRPLHAVLGVAHPPPVPTPVSSESLAPTTAMPRGVPKAVGGWLVFFCVWITVIYPSITIAAMIDTWQKAHSSFGEFPALKSVCVWENFSVSVLLIYGIVVGCMIWNGNPRGRDIARHYLLVRLFGLSGSTLVSLNILGNLPTEFITGGLIGCAGTWYREGLLFAVWWIYFKKSKRVLDTYGYESSR